MGNNFGERLEELIMLNQVKGFIPRLLLHSCCAPCSSYVIEYLSKYFYITILYYNPNISPFMEYNKRKAEQKRLIQEMPTVYPVEFLDCDYENDLYEQAICGLEEEPERGKRCSVCFRLRLEKTAKIAREKGFDYFGTTLTLSPYKNCRVINEIGENLSQVFGIPYMVSDFKKKNGYKRSIELSHEYGLYRQNYCGCKYSKRDREQLEEKS